MWMFVGIPVTGCGYLYVNDFRSPLNLAFEVLPRYRLYDISQTLVDR